MDIICLLRYHSPKFEHFFFLTNSKRVTTFSDSDIRNLLITLYFTVYYKSYPSIGIKFCNSSDIGLTENTDPPQKGDVDNMELYISFP